jgi:hypothetical protein
MNHETGIQNHDYYIDNKKIDISVTGIIHKNFPHFDPDAVADKIVNGRRWGSDPSYKYYQVPKEDMIEAWSNAGKEASGLGSIMHMDIEMFYNYLAFVYKLYDFVNFDSEEKQYFTKDAKQVEWKKFVVDFCDEANSKDISNEQIRSVLCSRTPTYEEIVELRKLTKTVNMYSDHILRFFTNHSPEYEQFIDFYNSSRQEIFPFRTELIMFDEEYSLAGSIDMLFKDKHGNILIYDWKRSKEFKYDNKWQKGFGLLSHLDDCNINHYSLQLNMYRRILESKYGEKVTGMVLLRFHPNIDTFDKYEANVMNQEIQAILDNRKMSLEEMKKNETVASEM